MMLVGCYLYCSCLYAMVIHYGIHTPLFLCVHACVRVLSKCMFANGVREVRSWCSTGLFCFLTRACVCVCVGAAVLCCCFVAPQLTAAALLLSAFVLRHCRVAIGIATDQRCHLHR